MSVLEGIPIALVGFLVVFIILCLISVMITAVSKIVNKFIPKQEAVVLKQDNEVVSGAYGGEVLLEGISEKEAACLMGIVIDDLKVKPHELIFKAIRKVDEA